MVSKRANHTRYLSIPSGKYQVTAGVPSLGVLYYGIKQVWNAHFKMSNLEKLHKSNTASMSLVAYASRFWDPTSSMFFRMIDEER